MVFHFTKLILDLLYPYFYAEECYLKFDEASEFSPYIKTHFCHKYFLLNDIIYNLIIITLSVLIIIQFIYKDKSEILSPKIDSFTNESDLNYYPKKENDISMEENIKELNNLKITFDKVKDLMKDNDALVNENEDLMKDNDALVNENEDLIKDNDALVKENKYLMKYNDALMKEKEDYMKDNDALARKNDALSKELELYEKTIQSIKNNRELFDITEFTQNVPYYSRTVKLIDQLKEDLILVRES